MLLVKLVNGIVASVAMLVIGSYVGANFSTPEVPYLICGNTEDDCYPDYRGNGKWVMVPGEKP